METQNAGTIHSYLDWAKQGRAAWWRYLLGALISLGVLLGGSAILLFPAMLFVPLLRERTSLSSLINMVLSFLVSLAALWLVLKLLHKRPLWSAGFPAPKMEWWNLGVGMAAKLGVVAVTILIYALSGISRVTFQVPDLATYLHFALLSAAVLLIQTGTEEMVFRGYLAQAVRYFTANPLAFLLIPAIVFALPHITNIAAFGGKWYAMLPYLVDGLVFGWLAYCTGSLWMSIGVHWTNNLTLSILYSLRDAGDVIPSAAIIQMTMPSNEILIGIAVVLSLLLAGCLTWVISRREKMAAAPAVVEG